MGLYKLEVSPLEVMEQMDGCAVQNGGGLQVGDITLGDAGMVGGGGESIICQVGGCMLIYYHRWTGTTTMYSAQVRAGTI